jgi:hypothetical protein
MTTKAGDAGANTQLIAQMNDIGDIPAGWNEPN